MRTRRCKRSGGARSSRRRSRWGEWFEGGPAEAACSGTRGRTVRRASADARRRPRRPARRQSQENGIADGGLIIGGRSDAWRRREDEIGDDGEELRRSVAARSGAMRATIARDFHGSVRVVRFVAGRRSRMRSRRHDRAARKLWRTVARKGEALQQQQTDGHACRQRAHSGPRESLLCVHFFIIRRRPPTSQRSNSETKANLERCCDEDTESSDLSRLDPSSAQSASIIST